MPQTVRMVKTLDLANAPRTGRQRWQFRLPFAWVGGNLDDSSVHNMGVHHTTAAAIVAASARDNVFARTRAQAGLLVKGAVHLSERSDSFRYSAACASVKHFSPTYIPRVRGVEKDISIVGQRVSAIKPFSSSYTVPSAQSRTRYSPPLLSSWASGSRTTRVHRPVASNPANCMIGQRG